MYPLKSPVGIVLQLGFTQIYAEIDQLFSESPRPLLASSR